MIGETVTVISRQEIAAKLRFVDDEDTECIGNLDTRQSCVMGNGDPAFAIHLWEGKAVCPWHSPVPNVYVPCTRCGELPVSKPESIEEDPICEPCMKELLAEIGDKAMEGAPIEIVTVHFSDED